MAAVAVGVAGLWLMLATVWPCCDLAWAWARTCWGTMTSWPVSVRTRTTPEEESKQSSALVVSRGDARRPSAGQWKNNQPWLINGFSHVSKQKCQMMDLLLYLRFQTITVKQWWRKSTQMWLNSSLKSMCLTWELVNIHILINYYNPLMIFHVKCQKILAVQADVPRCLWLVQNVALFSRKEALWPVSISKHSAPIVTESTSRLELLTLRENNHGAGWLIRHFFL